LDITADEYASICVAHSASPRFRSIRRHRRSARRWIETIRRRVSPPLPSGRSCWDWWSDRDLTRKSHSPGQRGIAGGQRRSKKFHAHDGRSTRRRLLRAARDRWSLQFGHQSRIVGHLAWLVLTAPRLRLHQPGSSRASTLSGSGSTGSGMSSGSESRQAATLLG
jgi:hypothetical protein